MHNQGGIDRWAVRLVGSGAGLSLRVSNLEPAARLNDFLGADEQFVLFARLQSEVGSSSAVTAIRPLLVARSICRAWLVTVNAVLRSAEWQALCLPLKDLVLVGASAQAIRGRVAGYASQALGSPLSLLSELCVRNSSLLPLELALHLHAPVEVVRSLLQIPFLEETFGCGAHIAACEGLEADFIASLNQSIWNMREGDFEGDEEGWSPLVHAIVCRASPEVVLRRVSGVMSTGGGLLYDRSAALLHGGSAAHCHTRCPVPTQ